MNRILLYTDERLLEEGLRIALETTPEFPFEVIGACRTHEELLREAEATRPAIILYNMAGEPDLSLVGEVRRVAPSSSIVLLGREFSPEVGHQSLEMGVRGMISTTTAPETLRECLRVCASGHSYVEGSLSAELLNAHTVNLSPRQSELVALLLRGLKNKEIAAEMGISVSTVKAYMSALFEKVQAKDRFELALFGLKNLKNMRQGADGLGNLPQLTLHSLVPPAAVPPIEPVRGGAGHLTGVGSKNDRKGKFHGRANSIHTAWTL